MKSLLSYFKLFPSKLNFKVCLDLILTFLIGLIFAIRFMLQVKQQDKEEYERKKAKDELDYKETELRYKKLLEDKR